MTVPKKDIEAIAAKLAAAKLEDMPVDVALLRFSTICGDVLFTKDEMLCLVDLAQELSGARELKRRLN
jgi:hypothetical protein